MLRQHSTVPPAMSISPATPVSPGLPASPRRARPACRPGRRCRGCLDPFPSEWPLLLTRGGGWARRFLHRQGATRWHQSQVRRQRGGGGAERRARQWRRRRLAGSRLVPAWCRANEQQRGRRPSVLVVECKQRPPFLPIEAPHLGWAWTISRRLPTLPGCILGAAALACSWAPRHWWSAVLLSALVPPELLDTGPPPAQVGLLPSATL